MGGLRQLLRRQFTVFLTLIAMLSISLFPQAKPKRNSPTTMRVATHLVTISAVATDKGGNPVTGLRADDFEVLDGGHPQKISFFSTFTDQPSPAGRPLPPDTYTNLLTRTRPMPPNITILFFDTLNSRKISQGWGMEGVRKFLGQIQPRDHVGIYVLGDDLKVIHDFTHDDSDLVQGLARYNEEHTLKETAAWKSAKDDSELARFLAGKDIHNRWENEAEILPGLERRALLDDNYQISLAALQIIGRHLAGVPGRKTLIWISDRLPSGLLSDDLESYAEATGRRFGSFSESIRGDIENMVRLMNQNGVAVYPISAEGLEAESLGFRGAGAGPGSAIPDMIGEDHGPMLELARRTGGRAFYNRNDLQTGMRRALDDSRFAYSLAYYPDHNNWKGEWRKIQVKVSRPGVIVLARGGYFALPDPRPVPPKSRIAFLSQIAASPVESTELPLIVHIAPSSSARGPEIGVIVHMNPRAMLTNQSNRHWKGNFEVMFMQLDANNKLLDATQKDVDADLDPKKYATVARKGWDLRTNLKFISGATLLCVILHDKSSDATGSVRIPLAPYSTALAAH